MFDCFIQISTTGELHQVVNNIYNYFKKPQLPSTSNSFEGSYFYKSENLGISVEYQHIGSQNVANIQISSANLNAKLSLFKDDKHEEVVMVSPLNAQGSMFYYNTKSYCLNVKGEVNFKNKIFNLEQLNSLGGRDIGRGVWNYYSFWFWAHFQGFTNVNGKKVSIGINLGNGFEHESTNTYEDSVILGDENYFVIQSHFKQYFGTISGWFIDENGNKISFENIQGLSEYHKAKW
ncbi:hypothetical protein IMG5_062820 [Ichthyophthirius multifiliis]|uniref:DUF2804 domain-containing protein n=1 Tax=Ichthyophthirius multifiliis TaxID=5932 RepID=G0QNZ9_ICHMU|nr:hypothetical protein IMG5_062820 [Ichthyophthirius multifiliis]EGR33057.1 hypothetical protein IMG5_062820 [Ichthyophthirius multifiliis]|eukprot:XP_004037043.1 hypothetical protein IMG5_062820 [Ichthyophthirius multifiliis]